MPSMPIYSHSQKWKKGECLIFCVSAFFLGGKAFWKQDSKVRERCLPILDGLSPFLRDVVHRQIHLSEHSLFAGKDRLSLNHLTQRTVERFDRVGRIDDAANFHRIVEDRNDMLPVPYPDGSGIDYYEELKS